MLITADIYWNSSWHNLRSPQFRSDLYLAQWVHTYTQVRNRLAHPRQHAVPGFVRRHAGNLTAQDVSLWRTVAASIGMHAAFTCLKPRQLITFSGLTLGTYLAFAG